MSETQFGIFEKIALNVNNWKTCRWRFEDKSNVLLLDTTQLIAGVFRTHHTPCHVCLLCCCSELRKVNVKTSEHFLAGKLCCAGRAGAVLCSGPASEWKLVAVWRWCGLSPDTGRDTLRPPAPGYCWLFKLGRGMWRRHTCYFLQPTSYKRQGERENIGQMRNCFITRIFGEIIDI